MTIPITSAAVPGSSVGSSERIPPLPDPPSQTPPLETRMNAVEKDIAYIKVALQQLLGFYQAQNPVTTGRESMAPQPMTTIVADVSTSSQELETVWDSSWDRSTEELRQTMIAFAERQREDLKAEWIAILKRRFGEDYDREYTVPPLAEESKKAQEPQRTRDSRDDDRLSLENSMLPLRNFVEQVAGQKQEASMVESSTENPKMEVCYDELELLKQNQGRFELVDAHIQNRNSKITHEGKFSYTLLAWKNLGVRKIPIKRRYHRARKKKTGRDDSVFQTNYTPQRDLVQARRSYGMFQEAFTPENSTRRLKLKGKMFKVRHRSFKSSREHRGKRGRSVRSGHFGCEFGPRNTSNGSSDEDRIVIWLERDPRDWNQFSRVVNWLGKTHSGDYQDWRRNLCKLTFCSCILNLLLCYHDIEVEKLSCSEEFSADLEAWSRMGIYHYAYKLMLLVDNVLAIIQLQWEWPIHRVLNFGRHIFQMELLVVMRVMCVSTIACFHLEDKVSFYGASRVMDKLLGCDGEKEKPRNIKNKVKKENSRTSRDVLTISGLKKLCFVKGAEKSDAHMLLLVKDISLYSRPQTEVKHHCVGDQIHAKQVTRLEASVQDINVICCELGVYKFAWEEEKLQADPTQTVAGFEALYKRLVEEKRFKKMKPKIRENDAKKEDKIYFLKAVWYLDKNIIITLIIVASTIQEGWFKVEFKIEIFILFERVETWVQDENKDQKREVSVLKFLSKRVEEKSYNTHSGEVGLFLVSWELSVSKWVFSCEDQTILQTTTTWAVWDVSTTVFVVFHFLPP